MNPIATRCDGGMVQTVYEYESRLSVGRPRMCNIFPHRLIVRMTFLQSPPSKEGCPQSARAMACWLAPSLRRSPSKTVVPGPITART